MSNANKHTYGQILKSSALIGSSSVISIVFGILRTKALALLLGPSGIGLVGIYGSIVDLVRMAAGMGINTSGVRQIAEAVGTGDRRHIARTVTTLRRVALYSGAAGALLLLIFAKAVSRLTFGNEEHAGAVAVLALAAFFADVSAGQTALIQGMRRISDLARMNILGALFGTLFSIPLVYFFREKGVALFLVCVSAMGVITSWWYARKIEVEKVQTTVKEVVQEASVLLKLGVVFMVTGLMAMGTAYLIRIIVTRKLGVEAAGYYQSAWVLGGLYIGFILGAMGSDFYPRLTAAAKDHDVCNRLVNEQAEIGLLLAGPGIIATLTFAPLVIQIFYSAKFGPAVEILRWICLGMLLRVVSWPMGFILLAKGEGKLFFWTEFICALAQIGLVWLGLQFFGLNGAGMAFFGLYIVSWLLTYLVVRRLTGFRWSTPNRKLALRLVPLVAIVFISWYFVPPLVSVILGGVLTLLSGIYSVRALSLLVSLERLPKVAQKMLLFFRLTYI